MTPRITSLGRPLRFHLLLNNSDNFRYHTVNRQGLNATVNGGQNRPPRPSVARVSRRINVRKFILNSGRNGLPLLLNVTRSTNASTTLTSTNLVTNGGPHTSLGITGYRD